MPRAKKVRTKTLVNYVLDASGSMNQIADQVRAGFKEYVDELKKNEDEIFLTLTQFNTDVTTDYVAKPVSEIEGILYMPTGMTALYDAVGKTIRKVEQQTDDNTKVITVIMTDGYENSSREFDEKSLNALITEKQDEGNWTFVFLGADQDAWATASRLGVYAGNTMSYAGHSHGMAMRNLATSTVTATASAAPSTVSFFQDAGQSAEDYQFDPVDVKEPESDDSSSTT